MLLDFSLTIKISSFAENNKINLPHCDLQTHCGRFCIVFTSNKHPSHWRANFNEDVLLCSQDRIFDDAMVFSIKGESFRVKKLETVELQTSRAKEPASSEMPTP